MIIIIVIVIVIIVIIIIIQTLRAFRLAQLGDLEAWRLRGKVAKKLR